MRKGSVCVYNVGCLPSYKTNNVNTSSLDLRPISQFPRAIIHTFHNKMLVSKQSQSKQGYETRPEKTSILCSHIITLLRIFALWSFQKYSKVKTKKTKMICQPKPWYTLMPYPMIYGTCNQIWLSKGGSNRKLLIS